MIILLCLYVCYLSYFVSGAKLSSCYLTSNKVKFETLLWKICSFIFASDKHDFYFCLYCKLCCYFTQPDLKAREESSEDDVPSLDRVGDLEDHLVGHPGHFVVGARTVRPVTAE